MPIDYETLIHEPARRMDEECKPMTIEVTQEDKAAAKRIVLEFKGKEWPAKEEEIANFLARHRQAAYEKGGRDAVERLTGLGGGS